MTDSPSSVTTRVERIWADEPDCAVLRFRQGHDIWVVARDGRSERLAGPGAEDRADTLVRTWASELGGTWKYGEELEALRRWREAGAKPEDKPQRWSVGSFQPRRAPQDQARGERTSGDTPGASRARSWRRQMGMPDLQRCEASLSAAVYRKRSKADGTYDHKRWLGYDGNHVRCENPTRKMHAGREGLVGVCLVHSAVVKRSGTYFPYLEPGEGCPQPCCHKDDEERRVSDTEA